MVNYIQEMYQVSISDTSIKSYCKRDILINDKSYQRNKLLQQLGSIDDVVGLTSTSLGFHFESYNH
jgi:hypothetical protein